MKTCQQNIWLITGNNNKRMSLSNKALSYCFYIDRCRNILLWKILPHPLLEFDIQLFRISLLLQQKTKASFMSKLEKWLECHICRETVRQSKTLQCFHSFCEDCLRQVTKKMPTGKEGVQCPVCNAFTEKNELKTNYLMWELLDVYTGKYHKTSIIRTLNEISAFPKLVSCS